MISVAATLFIPVIVGKAIDAMVEKNNVDFDLVMKIIYTLLGTLSIGALANYLLNFYNL
ncbi:MAG: hypothetical protein L6U99_08670 [Clostridium sp.]|nr:MAG: hypothetical protein L6U99_08670 [Clostridium sp.]